MPPPAKSQGYAAGNRSVSRGELDSTMRSMREGKLRARSHASRPLSRIFLDGSGGNIGRPQ
jgi:diaphanous 1